jgi:hypothetical protein
MGLMGNTGRPCVRPKRWHTRLVRGGGCGELDEVLCVVDTETETEGRGIGLMEYCSCRNTAGPGWGKAGVLSPCTRS